MIPLGRITRMQLAGRLHQQRCLVMLSNDVRAERIYPELTRAILGQTRMPWTWEYQWLTPAAIER